jgi:hypothetical protein
MNAQGGGNGGGALVFVGDKRLTCLTRDTCATAELEPLVRAGDNKADEKFAYCIFFEGKIISMCSRYCF